MVSILDMELDLGTLMASSDPMTSVHGYYSQLTVGWLVTPSLDTIRNERKVDHTQIMIHLALLIFIFFKTSERWRAPPQ